MVVEAWCSASAHWANSVEMEKDPVATVRANRPWEVIDADIHEVPSELLEERGALKRGEVDLLVGGPPCQPFSKSGYWARGDSRRLADPRATTLAGEL